MSGKRRKNQLLLAFMAESRSESPMAAMEGTEPRVAKQSSESPTQTDSLMEEVCQRDNLWKALKRVQANKGAPGVDGMTVLTGIYASCENSGKNGNTVVTHRKH